jgi:hypothetical protein
MASSFVNKLKIVIICFLFHKNIINRAITLKKFFLIILISCICSTILIPVSADIDVAMKANQKGDRATAFNEFYASAQQKDERSYGKLAAMYLYGLGTEKNYIQAYIWFHMAYLTGEKNAERFREAATSKMNREVYFEAVDAAEKQRIKLGLYKK